MGTYTVHVTNTVVLETYLEIEAVDQAAALKMAADMIARGECDWVETDSEREYDIEED